MDILERILQGAILEFKENGVKFTMDSLAKRLGMSKRTLYERVPSKTDVIQFVIDRTFEDVKRQQKVILEDKNITTKERLKRLLTVIPTYATVLDMRRVNELKTTYPALYEKIEYNIETDWEATIALFEQAMEEGIIRKVNVVILKLLLCNVYEQLIGGDLLLQNNISYEMAMDNIMDLLFEGLYVQGKGESQ